MSAATTDVVWTYTLQIVGPTHPTSYPLPAPLAHWEPRVDPELLREAEENLTDLLPEGYYAKIDEWDR